ncbi:MAG TPA: molybdopterin molybdenumtransferase MoeA [Gammaproteobacteria bacterium]|nr:molybdopterin molybdenumtransferase MoeA [Gammaproteobacteria bacterium]
MLRENDCSPDPALVPVAEAIDFLLLQANPIRETENISISQALGRVLANDLTSSIDVPPADNSAMDGYAARLSDLSTESATTLPISQRICAGAVGTPLSPKSVARIFTGAPIPEHADVVIMQENCSAKGDQVTLSAKLKLGQNIRRAGEDIQSGSTILKQGTLFRAQEMGLAASVGIAEIPVFNKLKIGIFSTGDELCEPGEQALPGQIYNSNRYTLKGLLQASGCEIVDLGATADTLDATEKSLKNAATQADLIISTGGVSVGEEDHVRAALENLGELKMWRINMRPGKPLAFGHIQSTPFIGLPGNPVSVFVTYLIFALPFIAKMQGRTRYQPTHYQLPADFNWDRPDSRMEFLRARINRETIPATLQIFSHQGSGVLTSTCWADGLLVIPPETKITKGDLVQFIPFKEFF